MKKRFHLREYRESIDSKRTDLQALGFCDVCHIAFQCPRWTSACYLMLLLLIGYPPPHDGSSLHLCKGSVVIRAAYFLRDLARLQLLLFPCRHTVGELEVALD